MGGLFDCRRFRDLSVVVGAAVLALAALAASCAAPSRRLTSRQVQDPIVLPRRMASIEVEPYLNVYSTGGRRDGIGGYIRIGLTDRLELYDLLSLRYAFLDDSPGSSRPGVPLSLALRAGARGVGWSSLDGWVIMPVLSLTALKHVGDSWRFWGGISWEGQWTQRSPDLIVGYDDSLGLTNRRRSFFGGNVGADRQLIDRIALSGWLSAFQGQYCFNPFCSWASRGGSAGLTFSYRPWHWFTWSVSPYVGGRYRPLIVVEPQNPAGPVYLPPQHAGWVGISTSFQFYW